MNRILRLTMALATAFCSTPAWAALEQEIEVKVQQRYQKTLNAPRNANPEEYGEIPNGLVLERYMLDFQNDKYMMDVEATNIGLNNQAIKVSGGQPGKMTWKVGWDEMPHLFSNEARTPYVDAGNGVLALPGGFRNRELTTVDYAAGNANSTLQGQRNAKFNTGISTALANIPYTPLGFDVNTANMDLKFHPAHDFTVELGGWRQTKRGTKAQAASFGFSNAIEVAAPIDWETNEAYLDLQLAKKDYQLAFNYRLSDFNNKIPNLYWDNPKRLTDQYAQNGYSQGDQSKNGAMAMAPDNEAHALKVEGGVNLPLHSRFSFEAGYQLWKALNAMLPYTTNTAIAPGALAVAQGAQYVPAFDASAMSSRPAEDVSGKIEVYTYLGKLSSRPLHWLRTALSHEAYIMENKSTQYSVPGWAVFDQGWHAENKTTPREQFRDDKTTLHVDYDITDWLSGNVGLMHKYKKQTREVSKLREFAGDLGFVVRPSRELFVNIAYQMMARRGNGMDFQHYPVATDSNNRQWFTEAPGMRRPDIADKNRNQGRLQVQWTPGEASYGLSARMSEDLYRQGKGDLTGGDPLVYPDLFGTLSDRQVAVGGDVSVPVGEKFVVDAYYEYENTKRVLRSNQTAAASGYITGAGGTFVMTQDPRYRWTTRLTDNAHIAGMNVTWNTTGKLKTMFGYDIVSTRFNGDPIETGSLVTNYKPYETSRRMLQTLKARGEYKVLKDLTFVANYMYEKFDATDFAYSEVPLRNGTDAIFLGANPIRNYYAHTVGAGLNYKF